MNLKLENSLVVLSQRKKEQGLPQRPTKKRTEPGADPGGTPVTALSGTDFPDA